MQLLNAGKVEPEVALPKPTALGAFYRRLAARIGKAKALISTSSAIASVSSSSCSAVLRIELAPTAELSDLRQEPYAVAPHVRICEGGVKQLASLPRHDGTERDCFRELGPLLQYDEAIL